MHLKKIEKFTMNAPGIPYRLVSKAEIKAKGNMNEAF